MFIGIDTGGTFTDFVLIDGDRVRLHKVLSTPQAPEAAILRGLADLGLTAGSAAARSARIVHGSTVATNAALEGRGARTVYLADKGLADVLTLGRQDRSELYALAPAPLAPPVPRELCIEVAARLAADGSAVQTLTDTEINRLVEVLRGLAPEAVAINLVFSWLDDAHERRLETALRDALGTTTFVTRSSFVLPEYREYERGIATWLNASLGPRVEGYLQRLAAAVAPAPLAIMQSSGGTMEAGVASQRAVNLLLSGPAGGLAAAAHLAARAGIERLLTFDMGGTSTDVALVQGKAVLTTEARIGPWPVAVPMLDIHTIGAGGGSLARVDAGGALQVGPESAGARPGPVCYGRGGTVATVTDANLVLGHLPAAAALGGSLRMDAPAALKALTELGGAMGFSGDAASERAARGVLDLANEHMAAALRVMSIERGVDPRGAVLCCFGGAGGLHICAIAERLDMREAMVPVHAGVLSALGMLVARPERQVSRTLGQALADLDEDELGQRLAELEHQGRDELVAEGHDGEALVAEPSLDLRYAGQAFALNLPCADAAPGTFCATMAAAFEAAHAERYGHSLDAAVEVQTLRVRIQAPAPDLPALLLEQRDGPGPRGGAEVSSSEVSGVDAPVPILPRASLDRHGETSGPAIITEDTSTTWLAPGWTLRLDDEGNLRLKRESEA